MKGLYYIKTTLKGMVSNILGTIAYFIIFPLVMAGVFSMMNTFGHSGEIKIKPVELQVIDNDKSNTSEELKKLLEADGIKELVTLENESENKLIIAKGYGESILKSEKNNLILEVKEEKNTYPLEALKAILDKYHEGVQASVSGEENIKKIIGATIIQKEIIETTIHPITLGDNIAMMTSFVISMFIYNMLIAGGMDVSKNMDKRVKALPLKRGEIYNYGAISTFIYAFIVILAYVLIFKIANVAFLGDIIPLIGLVLVASILVASIVTFVGAVFGSKYGKYIGNGLFLIYIGGSEAFGQIAGGVGIVSPTKIIDDAFVSFNGAGNIIGHEKGLLIIVGISIALYIIGYLKTIKSKELVI